MGSSFDQIFVFEAFVWVTVICGFVNARRCSCQAASAIKRGLAPGMDLALWKKNLPHNKEREVQHFLYFYIKNEQ